MKFYRQFFPAMAALASTMALVSCQSDDFAQDAAGCEVELSVGIRFDADNATRTILSEENGNLKSTWEASDKVWVLDLAGNKLGELELVDGADTEYAHFNGTLTGLPSGDSQLQFIYFGRGVTPTEEEHAAGTYVYDFSKQDGTLASLSEQDMLYNVAKVSCDGNTAYTEEMGLKRYIAFGHFELVFPDGVNRTDETVTVSGERVLDHYTLAKTGNEGMSFVYDFAAESAITVTGASGNDLYLTILPTSDVTPTFSVTIDGKEYNGSLAPRDWTPSEYVRLEDPAGTYKGVPVSMTEVGGSDADDDMMVGPEIEIDGKTYRFTRGNLKYNTSTGVWTILDEQTYFVNAGGLGNTQKLSSGTLGTTPEEIGLFAWGATGLEDAMYPWTIRGNDYSTSYSGVYWPSLHTATNAAISNLWEYEYVYDWGRAYEESGRAADDNRHYVTPTQAIFKQLFENTFVQGCTIKGAGLNGEDVTGIICLPGIGKSDLASAKELIATVSGATCRSAMVSVIHNNTGNTLNYANIVLPNVESLKELNDAVFFPAASKRNLTSGTVYNSNGKGFYWTANSKSYSATSAVSICVGFDGTNGGFAYNGTTNYSYYGREHQLAVRLLVEVQK